MLARIHVTLKPGVNDPQGLAIAGGLRRLGFSGVEGVRAGRYLEVRSAPPTVGQRSGRWRRCASASWRTP